MNAFQKALKMRKSLKDDNLVFLYTMGKVGSKSIEKSFREIDVPHIHKHCFNFYRDFLKKMFGKYRSARYYYNRRWFKRTLGKYIGFAHLISVRTRKRTKVITLVREPISRNISMYMQDFQIPVFEVASYTGNVKTDKLRLENFIADFKDNFNHTYGIKWFDEEFKRRLKIDIYLYPFDKEKGYTIINTKKYEILVMQLERLDDSYSIIGDFVGESSFSIVNENTATSKWYYPIYKEFRRKLSFDDEYIRNMYESKFVKHFYSETDINKFREIYGGK